MTNPAKTPTVRSVAGTREVLAFDPNNLPLKVCLWYLLVAPVRPPKQSAGGIELDESTRQVEEHLTSAGKILDMGDFAYMAKTPSGLDLSTDSRKPVIGDYVLFQQYAGHRVKTKDGRLMVILTDTEVLGVLKADQVAQLQFYL